jgi:hypothetical protein
MAAMRRPGAPESISEAAPPHGPDSSRTARDSAVAAAWESPPPKPVLCVNGSAEAERARRLLETYDIDFETRATDGPAIALQWNGETFTDIFGIADFLAMAGRAVPSLRKTGRARRDEAIPGTRIPLERG